MGKTKQTKPDIVPVNNSRRGSISDMIGPSIQVDLPDGGSIVIPQNKTGNRTANMIMAAHIRAIIEKSIQTYRDKDMLPTPKDLKELAGAVALLSQFSKDLYVDEDAELGGKEPKPAEKPKSPEAESINFDEALGEKK